MVINYLRGGKLLKSAQSLQLTCEASFAFCVGALVKERCNLRSPTVLVVGMLTSLPLISLIVRSHGPQVN